MRTPDSRQAHRCNDSTLLQVLICAYGPDGLERVKKSAHPQTDGVEYLVSWQTEEYPPATVIYERNDLTIVTTGTKGLSVNRNTALSLASAPLILIGDDDADYSEDGLRNVMEGFKENPDADIIAFRYESTSSAKSYPSHSFSLSKLPKGYYISSIEIAFRREAVQGKIWFNEHFGIGATFPSGEEDIFITDCLQRGLNGIYLPRTVTRHDGVTTTGKSLALASRARTKGAVFLRRHPHDWPLRMIVNAARELPMWRKGLVPSPLSFCREWLKGVRIAGDNKVFPTPDYSDKYPSHE
ncbi:MAG: glycosyltransferase family 2 protein [Muribaculaceae bacterium]|nr:glycosyltransferase family 2 protein [Muribaculaceae bacterium]